jgi:hypothetical protein
VIRKRGTAAVDSATATPRGGLAALTWGFDPGWLPGVFGFA